ncbi:MAG: sigma-70 family RNA polymerase sigma factor [Clostridiales bacterium]|nr:sigma-70 family RNA polymerase sigma factor [Clostridiales bacterium]
MQNNEFESKFALMLTGDEEAFTYVYNETKKPVYTIINRIVNNRCESEDIMQDLFLRLITKTDLDIIKNPRAYIFMMARNMAIDSLRKDHPDYLDEDVTDRENSSFDEHICLTSSIEDAILQLDIKEREVISLHINAGMKFREISEYLGEPPGTLRSRYSLAIKKLRSIMKEG